MLILPKGSDKKFLINSNELIGIIKDNSSFNNYEEKLTSLESKLINELNENENFKQNFSKTIINIVEINENEKNDILKGFINGEKCNCTSITITILEDGIDILFNEDFNNSDIPTRPRVQSNKSYIIEGILYYFIYLLIIAIKNLNENYVLIFIIKIIIYLFIYYIYIYIYFFFFFFFF